MKYIYFILLILTISCADAVFIQLETRAVNTEIPVGSAISEEISIRNTDIVPYDILLSVNITHIESGQVIAQQTKTLTVKSALRELIQLPIPENAPLGEYRVRVTATYKNRYEETEVAGPISTLVSIYRPIFGYKLFGVPAIYIFYILCGIALLLVAYAVYNHHIEKRKRYQQQVDLSLLPVMSDRSAYIGKVAETDNKTYVTLNDLNTHTIIAGATGGGKTVSAQVIVEEALLKGISVIVFDPTAQWTGFLRKCKEKPMLKSYSSFGMSKGSARAFSGNIHSITNPREKIKLQDHIKPGEITIFTVNRLDPKEIDILVASTIRQVFHANLPESPELKVLLVYDEVHRLLPKFGGSGAGFLQIERACREFRKWGVGLFLISQVLSDFVGAIKANISTEILMRTRDEGDLERIRTRYGAKLATGIIKAPSGQGLLENPHYNKGLPYFVSFRPLLHSTTRLSDEELDRYNHYNNVIDDLTYQIDQIESRGIDIFDLRLELKLASDKLKTGTFNMVDIYLDGILPRIQEHWSRLGDTPKRRVKELVPMEDIQQSIQEAQIARSMNNAKK